MKVTLKDISEDSGFSISTISRVLNGSNKIKAKTRRQVYKSAQKLNYPISQTLNNKLTDTINVSLIMTEIDAGEFYSAFYSGFNRAAENQNVQLSLSIFNSSLEDSLLKYKNVSKRKIDGLILFTPEYDKSDYLKIRDALPNKYPVISNGLIESPVFSSVTFDGYSGGYLVAKHFSKRHYSQCGIIRGDFKAIEARYRSNGFIDYLTQNQDMELTWDYHGDFTFESGKKAFHAFHKLDDKPRAIFASNDAMCHAFLEEALIHGYSVPEDIAIAGYDDLPVCERHRPSITSVHTNYEKLGQVTLQKLKAVLHLPKQEEGLLSLIPVSLSVRESS